tara:strand:- start:1919 stop:3478 length:1560 start_codon:yes stop_codon:yes gene_type:complete
MMGSFSWRKFSFRILLFLAIHSTSVADCDTSEVELWGQCYPLTATNISLYNSGLTGPIPPEIGLFENLINLRLSFNNLSGSIPPEIGNLDSLETLELLYNNLSGPIPDELWGLTKLRQLRLQKNQFTGDIPSHLGDLTGLTHLYLNGNQFTGPIPSEIGNLSNIVKLHLNNNQFSGLIPESFCDIDLHFYNPYLFDISGNQLIPPYPDCVAYFTGYQYSEECESNYLFDGTCTEQADLDVLQVFIDNSTETINMEMDDNENGLIDPIELGTQHWWDGRLTELNCNYDLVNEGSFDDLGISGSIPDEIGNLESLEFLWLEDNQLTGPIPSSIGDLSNLKYLILHFNELTGPIPPSIGNLSNLEILKLDNNQLTGHIPDSICELDIAFNWQNDLFGDNFAVYNNQLCPPYPDCVSDYVGIQNCTLADIDADLIPMDYELREPYPNPFNARTTIRFSLPLKDILNIDIYDINGRRIQSLAHGIFERGQQEIYWDAGDLSSGVYFIMMSSRDFIKTKKVTLIK